MTDAEVFEECRGLMFAVAYRMLGTISDAEDAVQDAWLRWSAASRADIANPRAYLTRIITNTALNRLRAVRARREAYIGPWLPEVLLTEAGPDATERAELAESVSVAMLVVLESLTPDERAVFVLHEVFGFSLAEIAVALARPAPAVRQLAHRAREHVQAHRPRFDVDWDQQREVTARFLAAAAGGDIEGLMAVLAPDVTLLTDGGGRTRAALRPISGASKVARWIVGIAGRPDVGGAADLNLEPAEINGTPGTLITADGGAVAVLTLAVAAGQVTGIQLLVNPDKLTAIMAGRTLPRC